MQTDATFALGQPAALQAVSSLLSRVLPRHAAQFELLLTPQPDEQPHDVFSISATDHGRVQLSGSSAVALASALRWYLRHTARHAITPYGRPADLPDRLPLPAEPVTRSSRVRHRYFFNYCTFAYHTCWWSWQEWEPFIDWMAMSGVNMPLAITGQEAVWYNLLRSMGVEEREIAAFLPGPPYLPFFLMGCLDGFPGPLPKGWIEQRVTLQHKILARQRELGMTPVLCGFTGHVPAALQRLDPSLRTNTVDWCGHFRTSLLDPQHPRFRDIGTAFLREQQRLFGTDHLYSADPFIEMKPPSDDPQSLAEMARAIIRPMTDVDAQAVWVLQGWPFYFKRKFWRAPQVKGFLEAVPDGNLLVLDLSCEHVELWRETGAFAGKPWVWSIVHNFGGRMQLHGDLWRIAGAFDAAVADPGPPRAVSRRVSLMTSRPPPSGNQRRPSPELLDSICRIHPSRSPWLAPATVRCAMRSTRCNTRSD